jgi:RNA polymerase sigma-70 factor (ECF subfamily)
MLLIHARRPARLTTEGDLVLLPEQDRSTWDATLIEEGHDLVRRCLRRNQPGPYQLQAAINAVHTDARTSDDTDWPQILQLYDQLRAIAPTPVVELNRAVAVAEVDGPDAALEAIDSIEVPDVVAFHTVRADLLRRTGRLTEAREEYAAAIALAGNTVERAHLERSRDSLPRASADGRDDRTG